MFLGGSRRIVSESTTAPGGRRGIGSALALLSLLACCGLVPPAPALTRRTRWAAGIFIASLASLALLTPELAKAQTENVSLASSAVTQTSATLTLANNSAAWYYKSTTPAGTCSSMQTAATTMVNLTGLTPGNAHTYKAYSDSTCATVIATAPSFNTLAKTVTAERVTQTTVRLNFNARGAAWYYKRTTPTGGTCTALTANQTTETLSSLTINTSYTYKTYSDSSCTAANEISSVSFNTNRPPALTLEHGGVKNARVRVTEGNTAQMTVKIARTWPSAVTVPLRVVRGASSLYAEAGDYSVPSNVVMPAGQTSVNFNLQAVQDADRDDEWLIVTFNFGGLPESGPRPELGSGLVVEIADDDTTGPTNRPPALTLEHGGVKNVRVRVTEGNTAQMTVTMARAWPSAVTVPLRVVVKGASDPPHPLYAEAGDYSVPSNVVMPAGQTSVNFNFQAAQDADRDDEWLIVTFNSGGLPESGPRPELGSGLVVEIADDDGGAGGGGGQEDAAAGVTLSVAPNPVDEGSPVTVTVTLSKALTGAVAVPVTVTRVTSDENDHGTLSSIAVAAGQTTGTGAIATHLDADGDDETFTVAVNTASQPASLTAGSPSSVTVTIKDTQESTTVTPPAAFPNAPTGLAANPGVGQVALTWNTYVSGFGWEVSSDGGTTWATIEGATGSTTTHTVTGLTGGTQYTFKVRATGLLTSIKSTASAGVTATPLRTAESNASPPDPVTNIAVTHNGSSLTVTWDAPEGAATYDVTYTDAAAISWQRAAWGRAGTGLTIGGVEAGKSYVVGVRAKNALGESAWANSAPASVPAAPDAVTNIAVVHNGSSLTVTWAAPARATHYDVTYRGGGVTGRAAWNRAGTSLEIACDVRTGYENQNCISGGTAYIVGVRARNAGGESAWVESAPASLPVPGPVTDIAMVHHGAVLSVEWPAVAGATHYDVTYSGNGVNARAAWNMQRQSETGKQSLAIRCDSRAEYKDQHCIDGGSSYTVGVRARNAAGAGEWRDSAEAQPPSLAVADATVAEGATATLDFVVTLTRAVTGAVTVDYATSDGTATAGSDYTATSGTLTFAAGQTSKTVAVAVLADAVNEGSETLTLMLSNASGAPISDATATGTITNDGPIPAAWNARFGRTVADQVLEGLETRLRSAPAPGVEVNLAGERLEWPDASDTSQPVAQQVADQLAQRLVVGSGGSGDAALRTLKSHDLLASSSFALASPTSGGGLLSFWGRGAVTNFDGRDGELSLDGQVTTVMLGTDWRWGQWPDGGQARRSIAGLLLSRSTADGGYTGSDAGEVDAILTGVFPWIGHRFSHQLEAWGAAGYGQGELQVTPKQKDRAKNGATLTADLNLWLAAGGLRGTLVDGGSEGLTLTGKGDALVVGTSSGETRGMKAAEARVTRLRLGLEGHRPFVFGNPESGSGATLTPSLEVGLRHDGGDAETGFGLDLGGGIVLSHPERGLQAEVRGRGLLSHAAEGFRDRGFSGSLSWQQRPDSDLGAALSLSQTMGGLSSGGADALLSRTTLEGLAANAGDGNDDLNNQRLELQLSYGLPAFGERFTLTPELGLGFYDNGRDYRLGWSLTQPDGGESFAFSFDLTRRENGNGDGSAPEHGVELRLDTLF